MDELDAEWMEWLNEQGYDYNAEENQSRLAEDMAILYNTFVIRDAGKLACTD